MEQLGFQGGQVDIENSCTIAKKGKYR